MYRWIGGGVEPKGGECAKKRPNAKILSVKELCFCSSTFCSGSIELKLDSYDSSEMQDTF